MGCMNTCTCPTSFHPVAPTLFMHLHTDFRAMIVPHLVGCCGEADGNGCMREICGWWAEVKKNCDVLGLIM